MTSKRLIGHVGSGEFALMINGIGGQGVQLIGKTLTQAATAEGKHAMLAADYGGEMRGGPSRVSAVIGSAPLRALPVLPSADAAIIANDRFGGAVPDRLRPGALLLLNSSIVDLTRAGTAHRVVAVEATAIAAALGASQASGFVLLGAFNALTGLVAEQSLVDAMISLLPPYRRQHAATNARALRAGAEAVAGAAVGAGR